MMSIVKIATITTGQTHNEMWYLMRKFRITASNIGLIVLSSRAYNLDGIKAIQWGRTHENDGIEFLKTSMNLDVQQTGIWLKTSGNLGASSDRLVGADSIVEVKCPYSYRHDILSETLRNTDKYIIYYNDRGEIVINTNHNYYHQIQGNLHISKRQISNFCVINLSR